eukprot:COSAG06_NODE_6372_length_2961_cov_127.651992_1_plen_781_part_10
MSASSTAAVGVGVGLAVGAAASAAAAALWCTRPAAAAGGGITRPEARRLKPSALRRRALELGVSVAEIDDAEGVGGVDGLAALVQAAQTAQRGGRDDGIGALAGETESQALRVELSGLRVAALRGRAASAGIAEDQIDATYDANDPKAALVELLLRVEARSSSGGSDGGNAAHLPDDESSTTVTLPSEMAPAEQMLSVLLGGGDTCADMVTGALERGMDVLEQVSASSPRKSRRSLRDLSDRAECVLESVDAEWCDGVCRCGEDEMGQLCSLLVSVRGLSSSSGVSEMSDAVTALLECLDRCGSVAVQSIAVLSGGSDASDPSSSSSSVLSALESLRCLSDERLDGVDADEAAAYEAVLGHLSGLDACAGVEFVSSCMALHTLGCRNGVALCGRVDVIERAGDAVCRWLEYASSGGDDYEVGGAVGALLVLCFWEGGSKMPSESREPIEKAAFAAAKGGFGTAGKVFTEQGARDLFASSMKADVLSHEDISLACGWCWVLFCIGYMHPGALPTANESGVFSTALELYRRVEPSPLPGEWWSKTCDVVDATSSHLQCLWILLALVKRLPSAMQSSWWSELLDHAIRMCKLNASAGLSERDTMCINAMVQSLGIVELAAKDEAQHGMLVASDVTDALEYGILHDFAYAGHSIAAYASGTAVALVGRNEGGKVLRREAVHAVLERLHAFFRPGAVFLSAPIQTMMGHMARVTIMVVSDANKKHMLQFQPLIDMLLQCLIIDDDNHRKGHDGAGTWSGRSCCRRRSARRSAREVDSGEVDSAPRF